MDKKGDVSGMFLYLLGISINSGRNSCEIEFVRFLIEKLAIAVAIGRFYSENMADSSLRKTNHELIEVPYCYETFA